MTESEESENFENILGVLPKRKCTQCEHFRICAIYRSIAPGIEQFALPPQKPPIQVEYLAAICLEFNPLVTKSQIKRNKK